MEKKKNLGIYRFKNTSWLTIYSFAKERWLVARLLGPTSENSWNFSKHLWISTRTGFSVLMFGVLLVAAVGFR